ncbi:hypothetical protein E2C01_019238 [Portunus trituberculatus]|uniref:Uncharacterized protein n=1 Tax=Portunus trituberculatus TaxID=210409 RepID=A0A5B7DYH7_PORTR|nr:hypothetical protein [Portunus trituberculatus]
MAIRQLWTPQDELFGATGVVHGPDLRRRATAASEIIHGTFGVLKCKLASQGECGDHVRGGQVVPLSKTVCYRPAHWPPSLPPTVTFVGKTMPIGASRVLTQTTWQALHGNTRPQGIVMKEKEPPSIAHHPSLVCCHVVGASHEVEHSG